MNAFFNILYGLNSSTQNLSKINDFSSKNGQESWSERFLFAFASFELLLCLFSLSSSFSGFEGQASGLHHGEFASFGLFSVLAKAMITFC